LVNLKILLKANPGVQEAIGRLDFTKINLKLAVKSYPALFQVLLQQVLDTNYNIEVVAKFIDAMPIQWLRKLIGRSFLLDESNNSTIRALSKKLKELGEHDEYTREHSIMVALWSLKLYSNVLRSSEDALTKLSKFEFVGHPIKKTMLYSEDTLKTLSDNRYFKFSSVASKPLIIVTAKINTELAGSPMMLINKLSPRTIETFKSINENKENISWLPKLRPEESYPEFIDKVLILTNESDLEILRDSNIDFSLAKSEVPLYIAEVEFNYDEFIRESGTGILNSNVDGMETLFWGAAAHDLGKKQVDLKVLNKVGQLDQEEYVLMRGHPLASFASQLEILGKDSPDLGIPLLGFLHHEQMDGKGYSLGLTLNQIPLFARILSIADVFHALTSDRPYRKAMSYEKACEILLDDAKNGRGKWDPELVYIFVDLINHKYIKDKDDDSIVPN
jgi:HD-GYP domain-containing protein (c-di-GMP phosphodiesterase class II)